MSIYRIDCVGARYHICEDTFRLQHTFDYNAKKILVYSGPDGVNSMSVDAIIHKHRSARGASEIEGKLYYQGGCGFISDGLSFKEIAAYKIGNNNISAIISCEFGKRKCVLSGPHLEFAWAEHYLHLQNCDPRFLGLSKALFPFEGFRKHLWVDMLSALGLIKSEE